MGRPDRYWKGRSTLSKTIWGATCAIPLSASGNIWISKRPYWLAPNGTPDLVQKGQDRIIEICRAEGADCFVNPEGGMQLYASAAFRENRIELVFLIHEPRPYPQNSKEFLPRLSIIDVMMFNSREQIRRLLQDFRLVCAEDPV
jgi:hypothetical protein